MVNCVDQLMLIKTRGVVLKFIKYRDTSIIVNIYTESQGLQSYIVNGVRSARSKRNKIAFYQPLTLLELVVYYRDGRSLNRLSETRCSHPFYSISINPKKSAIALFMVEILSKTLKEQTQSQELFDFIWRSILQFDDEVYSPENFHLIFLVKLSRYLGFMPRNSYELFEELKTELDYNWVNSTEANRMNQLLSCDYLTAPLLNNKQRMESLNILLSLYRVHVEQFGIAKSVKILNQVFR